MLYKVTNLSETAPAIIYDARARAHTIAPGGSKDLEMDERAADRFRKRGMCTFQEGGERRAHASDDGVSYDRDNDKRSDRSDEDSGTGETSAGEDTSSGTGTSQVAEEAQVARSALLASYEAGGMSYPEFLTKAKELMGDEWPGGTPKKRVVVALLSGDDEE